MTRVEHARAGLSLAVITANLVFWLLLALPLGLVRLFWPGSRARLRRGLDWIYRAAVRVDDVWLERVVGLRWSCDALSLARGRSWIVLANHVSWADIFVLQHLLVREGLVVHFLSKRELLFVPVVGPVLFTFEFPLLRRTSRRSGDEALRKRLDFEALREACERARRDPVALVCFAEGTRATDARRAHADSPHRHLLPPRVGGFAALCDGLGEGLGGVVDVTLRYGQGPTNAISFWAFLGGCVREIGIEAQGFPPEAIPTDRAGRERWLAARWAAKDAAIDRRFARASLRPPSGGDTIAARRPGEREDTG